MQGAGSDGNPGAGLVNTLALAVGRLRDLLYALVVSVMALFLRPSAPAVQEDIPQPSKQDVAKDVDDGAR